MEACRFQEFVVKSRDKKWDMEFKVPFEEPWATRRLVLGDYVFANSVADTRMSIVNHSGNFERLINWRLYQLTEDNVQKLDITFWWATDDIVLIFTPLGDKITVDDRSFIARKPTFSFEFCSPPVAKEDIPDREAAERLVKSSVLFGMA